MNDRQLARLHGIADFRDAARRVLPRMVFDYVDGAAGLETTARANRDAFDRVRLVPSGPVDVSRRSTATTLFGAPLALPLLIGPTGLASALWPRGEVALARAAARAGIPFVLANASSVSLEDVRAASDGRQWFQLYLPPERERALPWLDRARDRYEAIELTVDTALPGLRNRDMRNTFAMPFRWSAAKLLDIALHPRWACRMAPHGTPLPQLLLTPAGSASGRFATQGEANRAKLSTSLGWDDVRWLRDQWRGRLLVKGLTDVRHAPQALASGIDGIVISTHGGRQLDGAVSSLEVLPEFVAAIGGRMPILVDSGFRTGSDIAKALALGATAVQIGRPTLYALAVAGEAGVDRALALLAAEFDTAMALCGATDPSKLDAASIRGRP